MGLFFYSLLPFKLIYIHFLSNALQSDLKVKVLGSWKRLWLSTKCEGIYSWHQNWGTLRCSVLCWTNLWKPKPTEWWSRLGSSHHNILSSGSGAEQCPVLCALLHCYIRPGEHQQRVDCVHCGSHFATHWFPREQTCWTVNTWTTGVSAKTNSFQKYM